jgi:hypothetical protein
MKNNLTPSNNHSNESSTEILVKSYTKKELAEMYGWSRGTLREYVRPFSNQLNLVKGRRYYTSKQVEQIFFHLGHPFLVKKAM